MSTLAGIVEPILALWLVTSSCLNVILIYVIVRIYSSKRSWVEQVSAQLGSQFGNVARDNPFLGTLLGLSSGSGGGTKKPTSQTASMPFTANILANLAPELAATSSKQQLHQLNIDSNIQWDHINRLFPTTTSSPPTSTNPTSPPSSTNPTSPPSTEQHQQTPATTVECPVAIAAAFDQAVRSLDLNKAVKSIDMNATVGQVMDSLGLTKNKRRKQQ